MTIQPPLSEERVNSLTHAVGLVLGVLACPALVLLAVRHGEMRHVVSCSIYGLSLIVLYAFSTFYHGMREPRLKSVFRTLDHVGVYLLIAGSYTPFALVSMRDRSGWLLLALVWGIAVLGSGLKVFYTGRFDLLSTVTYLLFGWLALLFLDPILEQVPSSAIVWLLGGGLAYTFGVIFYVWERPYTHATWHICVLVGSSCHYIAILRYVVPGAVA